MIIGGGKISYYLAKVINEVGVTSKIVEKNLEKCQELTEILPDSIIINGDGMDQEMLLSESLLDVDSFIALTDRDEDNIIASLFAANNNVDNVITKVTRDNYNSLALDLRINSIVSPKLATANKIIKYLRTVKNQRCCSIENIYKICNEKAEAIEFTVTEDTRNLGVAFKKIKFREDSLVATIVRNNKIIIPTGDDHLVIGDRVIVVTKNSNLLTLDDIIFGGAN